MKSVSYIYEYFIFERVDGIERLIASYESNVAPPSIGLILDLSEYTYYSQNMDYEYKVVETRTSPRDISRDEYFRVDVIVVPANPRHPPGEVRFE